MRSAGSLPDNARLTSDFGQNNGAGQCGDEQTRTLQVRIVRNLDAQSFLRLQGVRLEFSLSITYILFAALDTPSNPRWTVLRFAEQSMQWLSS